MSSCLSDIRAIDDQTKITVIPRKQADALWLQWRDLPSDAQLALTVWQVREGQAGSTARGGTTLRLFSKKARLKTGVQSLQVVPSPVCTAELLTRSSPAGWHEPGHPLSGPNFL